MTIVRGPLIDDSTMVSALDRGQLAVAILDVFDSDKSPSLGPPESSCNRPHVVPRLRNKVALGRAFL